jgi:hypothetical protein
MADDKRLLDEVMALAETAKALADARARLSSTHLALAEAMLLRLQIDRGDSLSYRNTCVAALASACAVESAASALRRLDDKHRITVDGPAVAKAMAHVRKCRGEVGLRIRLACWWHHPSA